jgi:acyl dehydratase
MSSVALPFACFEVGQQLPRYTVRAHNSAEASENKIHNTEVARQYGFKGGLVPGVTDYAYMTRSLAEALGIDWLEHGSISARFLKPLYEGEMTTITVTVTRSDADVVSFDVAALNGEGEVCASGSAALLSCPPAPPAADVIAVAPLPAARTEASPDSLAVGTVLGTFRVTFDERVVHEPYLTEVGDDLALYRGVDAVAHPGYTIRLANSVLVANVLLGPWIHVSSDTQHFRLVRDGDRLSARAVVTGLFERKGHEFVDLDVLVFANDTEPVLRVAHRAIYKVRPAP